MILLKNKKLRLELFLGLLLVIGAMPKGSQGLKCYHCLDIRTITINSDPGAEKPGGRNLGLLNIGPDCSSPDEIEKHPQTDRACEVCTYRDGGGKALSCGSKSEKKYDGCQKQPGPAGTKIDVCFCEKDLCNKNKATVEKSVSGGSGKSTPDGRLIFTILIAPIFIGYLRRGGMAEAAA